MRKLAIAAGLILGLGAAAHFLVPDMEIKVSEAEARAKIAVRLPIEIEKLGSTISVHAAQVDFLAEDKVAFAAEFTAAGGWVSGEGRLEGKSGLAYRDGAFFLKDIDLQDVHFTPSAATADDAAGLKGIARNFIGKVREGLAGDDPAAQALVDKSVARVSDAQKSRLTEMLNKAVETTPIYSLEGKGLKMRMAGMMLQDIRFTADHAEVSISPAKVIVTLAVGGVLLMISAVAGFGLVLGGGALGLLAMIGMT